MVNSPAQELNPVSANSASAAFFMNWNAPYFDPTAGVTEKASLVVPLIPYASR
jgi:hypothetical protein